MQILKNIKYIFFLIVIISCKKRPEVPPENIQVAFLADVHFQDIYAEFEDVNYKGIKNPETGEFANIRTMQSQLNSTRIFNENYFAFLEALDDISKRGIKIVVLPGDFSDDGQPIHIKGLTKILNEYAIKYGISFFATTGNHDPVRPFEHDGLKSNFLGYGGKEQAISSSKKSIKKDETYELNPIISSDIKKWGYKEIINEMSDFGFYPKEVYHYWESPFSNYSYEDYDLKVAQEQALLEKRTYQITANLSLPDVSYLVEPIDGLWLLAIDANVYVPNDKLSGLKDNPNDFSGASIGYNNVLLHKSHLIDWVKQVALKAKEKDKILIAFSHYPMVDFNDDASKELKQFFGDKKVQLHRVPNEDVAKTFADAGIEIHFGGHIHINDTGVRTTEKGNTLFNIQTPSLAAYIPAYKLLTVHSNSNSNSNFEFEVETVIIDSVSNFDNLFPFYQQEYAHLQTIKSSGIWKKDILQVKNYKEFTQEHLKELVRLRFLPNDWSIEFSEMLLKSSGKDLLLMNQNNSQLLNQQIASKNLSLSDFEAWTGFDMIYDFYRLRSADELAIPDIGLNRKQQYELVCSQLEKTNNDKLVLWSSIFKKVMNGQPANHFKINLKTNTIKRINP